MSTTSQDGQERELTREELVTLFQRSQWARQQQTQRVAQLLDENLDMAAIMNEQAQTIRVLQAKLEEAEATYDEIRTTWTPPDDDPPSPPESNGEMKSANAAFPPAIEQ